MCQESNVGNDKIQPDFENWGINSSIEIERLLIF